MRTGNYVLLRNVCLIKTSHCVVTAHVAILTRMYAMCTIQRARARDAPQCRRPAGHARHAHDEPRANPLHARYEVCVACSEVEAPVHLSVPGRPVCAITAAPATPLQQVPQLRCRADCTLYAGRQHCGGSPARRRRRRGWQPCQMLRPAAVPHSVSSLKQ